MKQKAAFWTSIDTETVQCLLCPHHCRIKEGKSGICGVRQNDKGVLYSLIYGSCSSIHDDPIEKKPLYHFYPGSLVLSLGSVGCTFRCEHCQNFQISTAGPDGMFFEEVPPERAVTLAKEHGCQGIAWTYNEPTIWHEYTLDSAKRAKQAGLYTVYVTNGFIEEDPLKEIAPYLDAMNIDVKAFHEEFYRKVCKARLAPVLHACECTKELGIHLEITYLVIPQLNDSLEEVTKFCQWIVDKLGNDVPVHFSRFHPDYKMTNVPATPIPTLLKIYEIAKTTGLQYVYIGNVPHGTYENTICPSCGTLLVERVGYSVHIRGLSGKTCTHCGAILPFRLREKT